MVYMVLPKRKSYIPKAFSDENEAKEYMEFLDLTYNCTSSLVVINGDVTDFSIDKE